MSELERRAKEASEAFPAKEILSFEWNGEKYWLKRARKTGSNLLHHAVWRLSHFPLLVPVEHQSPREALEHESTKLRRLATEGIPVPELLLQNDDYFVMAHTGPTLRSLLYRKAADERLTRKVFGALAALQRTGEYHGGSQLRNLTWTGETIAFIDFEEKFDSGADLKLLQLRDLFLLLFAFAKDRIPLDYASHIRLYCEESGNRDFDRQLREMIRPLGWVERIVAFPPLWKVLDKDTRATYRLFQEIKKL
jgi:RIO-like serine/threonine protein kinase